MTLTCRRCLDGAHARCVDLTCACTCASRRPDRPTAGGVLRTPRPARPKAKAKASGSIGPGRPRVWADDRERKREHMRRRRAADARAKAAAELAADPTGTTWSIGTRRLFAAEVARLEAAS